MEGRRENEETKENGTEKRGVSRLAFAHSFTLPCTDCFSSQKPSESNKLPKVRT